MRRILILAFGLLPLMGCAAAGPAITGLASAGIAGTVASASGSATAGAIVGFGVSYGVEQGVNYAERRIQGNIQDTIAATAGPLFIGQSAQWRTDETLPFSGKSGTVEVARQFGTAILCKDVVFTVEEDDNVYVTTICRNDSGAWRWAEAEPSVHRWGYLQ